MKKPPYPALVKPDAVVLLPPEESEERDPRGLWPETRRRPPWVSFAVTAGIFVAGLGIGLRLAARGAQSEPVASVAADGIAEASPAAPAGDADVGGMDAAEVPPPELDSPTPVPESEASSPPRRPPEPTASAPTPTVVRGGATTPRDRPPVERRQEVAAAIPPASEPAADTSALELAPAPVGRTLIPPAEASEAPVRSPLALEPPARDPAAVEQDARLALSRGAERFAAAVGLVRTGSTGALSAQVLASDNAARALLQFVQNSKPTASVAGLGPVTVRDGTAQADATVQLEWRGDFGVTRRGQVRVRLLAREGDGEWRVSGAQPLDGAPR